jgi:ATP-dependent Clp protease ATP-binding subunit ClpA
MSSAGIEAARRKFTPEFMNRIDKTVVFHSLGARELRQVLEIELHQVQQRIHKAETSPRFLMNVTESARDFLLGEGTDVRYGARPLKRAIERLIVQPLSNLIVTGQIRHGDCIRVTHSESAAILTFFRDARVSQSWEEASGVAA